MSKGILGRKIGMTQIFSEDGKLIPVTVLDCTDNVVLQQKTVEKDGYVATQLGCQSKRESLANKPILGHVAKANTAPKRFVKELRFKHSASELAGLAVGQIVESTIFKEGELVDVIGITKGKGFQGSIKRHGQRRGPEAHGSRYHRAPGSMGAIKGNMKGKPLPGHMGHEQVTIQNLEVVKVDKEQSLLLIKGAVPGPNKGFVVVKSAVR